MEVNGFKVSVGADPELFVGLEDGTPIPAHGLVEGTKDKPLPVPHGAVQVDGLALEFNIDPADDYETFQGNLDKVQQTLMSMVPDLKMIQSPSVHFNRDIMDLLPPEALALGCEPDYNAYTMEENPPPNNDTTLRTVGGHAHIGGFPVDDPYNEGHMRFSARVARMMDEEVGIFSLLWDSDDERRTLYGKAGAFRPKKFGVEYRSLSNAWLYKPQLTKFVYDGIERALNKVFDFSYEPSVEIEGIINNSLRDHELLNTDRGNFVRKIMGA